MAGIKLKVVVQQIADARVEGGALGGGYAPLQFGTGIEKPVVMGARTVAGIVRDTLPDTH